MIFDLGAETRDPEDGEESVPFTVNRVLNNSKVWNTVFSYLEFGPGRAEPKVQQGGCCRCQCNGKSVKANINSRFVNRLQDAHTGNVREITGWSDW